LLPNAATGRTVVCARIPTYHKTFLLYVHGAPLYYTNTAHNTRARFTHLFLHRTAHTHTHYTHRIFADMFRAASSPARGHAKPTRLHPALPLLLLLLPRIAGKRSSTPPFPTHAAPRTSSHTRAAVWFSRALTPAATCRRLAPVSILPPCCRCFGATIPNATIRGLLGARGRFTRCTRTAAASRNERFDRAPARSLPALNHRLFVLA